MNFNEQAGKMQLMITSNTKEIHGVTMCRKHIFGKKTRRMVGLFWVNPKC